jgi:hypothetical protein
VIYSAKPPKCDGLWNLQGITHANVSINSINTAIFTFFPASVAFFLAIGSVLAWSWPVEAGSEGVPGSELNCVKKVS